MGESPVGKLRKKRKWTMRQLADQLRCSVGFASDLCNNREAISVRIAKRMEDLTGTAWHKFIPVRK